MIDERTFNELSEPISDLQNECNVEILSVFMKRIKSIKEKSDYNSSASYDEDLLEIGKIKDKYSSKIRKGIENAILTMAMLTYDDCDDLYGYAREHRPDFAKNKPILDLTNEMITAMLLLYNGLNDTYYVKTRSLKTPSIKTYISLESAYKQIMNKAQTTKESLLDFDALMEDVSDDLIKNTFKIYITQDLTANVGYYTVDTAYENLLNQTLVETSQRIYIQVGETLNFNGIELSAHLAPAVDHAPCQGHIFTNHNWDMIQSGLDFVDIDGNKYDGFPRHIGTCNCRHIARPFAIGQMEPTYKEVQLKRILIANERGYNTKDGKHYTFYECTQKLNYYKRQMKQAKNGIRLSKDVGNENLRKKYEAKYAKCKNMYEMFKKQLDKRLYVNN